MSKFCIVYDLETERERRYGLYSRMSMPFLMEAMCDFLEANPMPISSKRVLREGVEIFVQIHKNASTEELRNVSDDYLKMYRKELIS